MVLHLDLGLLSLLLLFVLGIGEQIKSAHRCSNNPCAKYESGNCTVYDESGNKGCIECQVGYFKISDGHPCMNCNFVFGNECKKCEDYVGCVECSRDDALLYLYQVNKIWYCDVNETQFRNGLLKACEIHNLTLDYYDRYIKYAMDFNRLSLWQSDGNDNYTQLALRYKTFIKTDEYISNYKGNYGNSRMNFSNFTTNNTINVNNHSINSFVGHNMFSDMTDTEFVSLFNDMEPHPFTKNKSWAGVFNNTSYIYSNFTAGTHNDTRRLMAVSATLSRDTEYKNQNWIPNCAPVKDQLGCGSCIIFAMTAEFECNYNAKLGFTHEKKRQFSEQYLVDCVNGSCNSGWDTSTVGDFLESPGHCGTGSPNLRDYDGTQSEDCMGCSKNFTVTAKHYTLDLEKPDDYEEIFDKTMDVVTNQISVKFGILMGTSFKQMNAAGITRNDLPLWDATCDRDDMPKNEDGRVTYPTHAMAIVGYTTGTIYGANEETNSQFTNGAFLVRNSYGSNDDWFKFFVGDSGQPPYFWLPKESAVNCGIYSVHWHEFDSNIKTIPLPNSSIKRIYFLFDILLIIYCFLFLFHL